MNIRRKTAVAVAALGLMSALVSLPSHALTLQGQENFRFTGMDVDNTILTLQGSDKSAEAWGSVGLNAWTKSDVLRGQAMPGVSLTRTLGELGVNSAASLRVVFNANEPFAEWGRGIVLEDLVLNIFSPTGALLYSSGAFMPVKFADTSSGVGNSGYVFALDGEQAAAAQAAAFGAGFQNNFIGLSATVLSAHGGPETFFVGSSPVPEPASWALAFAGLAGLTLVRRRGARRG